MPYINNYLDLNKVCDVWGGHPTHVDQGLSPHNLIANNVRNSCTWVKFTFRLQEVQC